MMTGRYERVGGDRLRALGPLRSDLWYSGPPILVGEAAGAPHRGALLHAHWDWQAKRALCGVTFRERVWSSGRLVKEPDCQRCAAALAARAASQTSTSVDAQPDASLVESSAPSGSPTTPEEG